jgi:hypothetical protein
MKESSLIIYQNKDFGEKELFISDIRSIGRLLNGIEFYYRNKLFFSKESEEFQNLSLPEKRRLYNKEFRIRVSRINKNSPLEIELVIQHLGAAIEIIDLFFSEEMQESMLKTVLSRLLSIDFDDENYKKMFNQFFSYYKNGRKIIEGLKLMIEYKNLN